MPSTATNLEQSASSVLPLVAALSAGVVCLVGLEEIIRLRRKHAANGASSKSDKDGKDGGRRDARHISAEEREGLTDPPRVQMSVIEGVQCLGSKKLPHLMEQWRDELGSDLYYVQLPLGHRVYVCTDISSWETLIGPDGLEKSDKYHSVDLFAEGALRSTVSIVTRKTTGENWHGIRKALSPAFAMKTLGLA
ncbi:unnamed protein product [Vitrella brassicaformis CCMP3155]|uniref:Uncharacterized protein n=1 Tax=Vitrella brassicaformis (strain CCMP3155) TaxID=1169540 RepID=A0A0G4FHC6_VITBC|nr:unnamed protein product [Vitrella brassicaformis CCMP3155]|eukprot:CEM12697.1 unnamed protein product [Vitrella brassicaformis CCMP3155]